MGKTVKEAVKVEHEVKTHVCMRVSWYVIRNSTVPPPPSPPTMHCREPNLALTAMPLNLRLQLIRVLLPHPPLAVLLHTCMYTLPARQ